MTPEELIRAGEEVFGAKWIRPLARKLGLSPRMIRYWKNGERRIREREADLIRALYQIGPVGSVIRRAIRRTVPGVEAWTAHSAAVQVLADLKETGLMK
jgi:hypothetical protein